LWGLARLHHFWTLFSRGTQGRWSGGVGWLLFFGLVSPWVTCNKFGIVVVEYST
jgi:hypothetical protein